MRSNPLRSVVLFTVGALLPVFGAATGSGAQIAIASGEIRDPGTVSGPVVLATYMSSPAARVLSPAEMLDHPMEAPGPWFSPLRVEWHKVRLETASAVGIDILLVHDNIEPMVLECLVEALRELRSERKGYPWIAPLAQDARKTAEFLESVPDWFLAKHPMQQARFGHLVWDADGFDRSLFPKRDQTVFAGDLFGGSIATAACSEMGDAPFDRESDLKEVWKQVAARAPRAVVISGWDDFAAGREILPSREYGVRLLDLTKLGIMQHRGGPQLAASFPWWNVPGKVAQQAIFRIEVGVTNRGIRGWASSDAIFLSCQWFKDGELLYADCPAAPITSQVKPGQTIPMSLGLAAAQADGTPFAEGDYELRIDLASGGEWFSGQGKARPISVPVHIGTTEDVDASVVESSLPRFLASDGVYSATVRVRNDGSKPWIKNAGYAVGFHWVRLTSGGGREVIGKQSGFSPVTADVDPGQTTEARFVVRVRDGKGAAIPTSSVPGRAYAIAWDLFDGTTWLSESGGDVGAERVCVVESDVAAVLFDCNLPSGLAAGDDFEVKVRIGNEGPRALKAASDVVTCTWYHLDGVRADCRPTSAPIWRDVGVGDAFVQRFEINTPEMPGRYIAEFRLGEAPPGGALVTRGADSVRKELAVVGSRVEYVDLSGVADVTAAAPAADPRGGDFDGSGGAFPLERFPPDVTESLALKSVYPTGYMTGAAVEERVSFSYLSARDGKANAVVCRGQRVEAIRAKCVRLHILGASVGEERTAEFKIDYRGAQGTARVRMAPWNSDSGAAGDRLGLATPYSLAGNSIRHGRASLFHYTVELDPTKEVSAVVLPNEPQIRIVALTLERVEEGYTTGGTGAEGL